MIHHHHDHAITLHIKPKHSKIILSNPSRANSWNGLGGAMSGNEYEEWFRFKILFDFYHFSSAKSFLLPRFIKAF